MPVNRRKVGIAAGLLIATGLAAWLAVPEASDKPPLGLFTTLPILWNESGSMTETLDGAGEPHWVRTALEADFQPVALDTLAAADLQGLDRLVMAQPRPLAPAENVALDDWVRGGGELLLFADPMLTEHSRFALGDRRRPQDVVLLSPILRRWGLELSFDEEGDAAERMATIGDLGVAVRYPGILSVREGGVESQCRIEGEGIVATCRIGKGRAFIIADAAMIEAEREGGEAVFAAVAARAFR